MSRARTAITTDGAVIASTLVPAAAHQLETALRHGNPDEGVIELDGGSDAYLRLATAGPAAIYAVSSIDGSGRRGDAWSEPEPRLDRRWRHRVGAARQRVAWPKILAERSDSCPHRWRRLPRLTT
jgi:hypothetical protein